MCKIKLDSKQSQMMTMMIMMMITMMIIEKICKAPLQAKEQLQRLVLHYVAMHLLNNMKITTYF